MRRHSDFNRTGRSSPRRCSQLSLFPPTTVIWLQIPPKGYVNTSIFTLLASSSWHSAAESGAWIINLESGRYAGFRPRNRETFRSNLRPARRMSRQTSGTSLAPQQRGHQGEGTHRCNWIQEPWKYYQTQSVLTQRLRKRSPPTLNTWPRRVRRSLMMAAVLSHIEMATLYFGMVQPFASA